MLAVILATASALAWGTSDFLGGHQSRRFDALGVLACSQLIGTGSLALVVLLVGGTFPEGEALAVILGGASLGVLALLAFYAALAVGTMSIVAPVASTGAALPLAMGLASGERPGTLQLMGIALAFTGVILAAREPTADAKAARNARLALGLALLSAVGFGSYFYSVDVAAEHADPLPTILAGRLAALAVVFAIVAIRRPRIPGGSRTWLALAGVGIFDVLANSLYALATKEGLLSVVSVLGSLYPAMTVMLAHLVLGERLAVAQRGGVAAALAGVALIAAG